MVFEPVVVSSSETRFGQGAAEAPAPEAAPGLISVLMPCCGQLELTRLCVPSVLRHTSVPYELVFLDIGSLDGTADYLDGLAAGAAVRVEVVRAASTLDLGPACAEAVARARGDFLVLLNNDTVVTHDWLSQLVALACLDPMLGLVGPMSNHAAAPQLVEAVPYRLRLRPEAEGPPDLSALDEFARRFRAEHRGRWLEVDRLGGFCLLVKRVVLARAGTLTATGGLGLFDSDAVCLKARQAGYRLACCRDLFVHRFGSRTFALGAPRAGL